MLKNDKTGILIPSAGLAVVMLCCSLAVAAAGYQPPSDISKEQTLADIKAFMNRPDIPLQRGDRGYVEDIIRIEAVDMQWDIGMSVHQPADPSRIPVGADGKKIGIFLLHGGSGDFKSMHKRADLLARKLGYKVISMSYPGRHAFHTEGRDWPGRNVTAYDHHKYSLEVRTPIWLRGERITRDQYDIIKDYSQRPRYGVRTLAKAKPGTTFYYRMAGWPVAFEKGGIAAMRKHFPEDEYSIYLHGHSTGGPFTMMLSQRVPNIAGIVAIENSSFGYIYRAQAAWGGELGKIEGYERVDEEIQLPPRSDPFDELYIRSWRDRARYAGPELLGQEGPEALMRLPMIMEDILDEWGDVQKRASFKAEYIITHGIENSLREAAAVTAKRINLNRAETRALVDHYIGLTRELEGSGVKPVPPILFQITAHSRDHSREVYEEVVIPMFKDMQPAPRVSLTQFALGTHGYMNGEYVEGVDLGIGPAVFKQWDDAIRGGYFNTREN
jgi:pimeloyl-ACP methyl ester carboxylesterase